MSFFDKAKQKAGEAAAKAKEGVEDVQQKRELSQAYGELGKTAFDLVSSGEISHPQFEATVTKIRDLNAKLAEPSSVGGGGGASDGGGDPSQPPAMPT